MLWEENVLGQGWGSSLNYRPSGGRRGAVQKQAEILPAAAESTRGSSHQTKNLTSLFCNKTLCLPVGQFKLQVTFRNLFRAIHMDIMYTQVYFYLLQ